MISSKSASKHEMVERFEKKSVVRHSITENYRNAREITEYVNSEMKMCMRPIGISGRVLEITMNAVADINIEADDRVVLICQQDDVEGVQKYITETLNKVCNTVVGQDNEIRRGIINVLPVSLTKGLEFEKVIVVPGGMSDSERYVSFTRALNELYVVTSD